MDNRNKGSIRNEFKRGSFSHALITWSPTFPYPSSYGYYFYGIILNGSAIESGALDGTPVIIIIDGLSSGVYNYTIVVYHYSMNWVSDIVIVTVLPQTTTSSTTTTSITTPTATTSDTSTSETTTTSTTTSSNPVNNNITMVLVFSAATGIVAILVIIVIFRKKG